jgi:hypothetical protein
MKIQVKDVSDVVSKQGPKAAYSVFELIYKSGDKVYTKNVMEFSKEAFNALRDAQPGDWFDVTTEKSKDGKYTNWIDVKPTTAESVSAATKPASRTGTTNTASGNEREFETAAERAHKQVCIVRQSTLGLALQFLATKGVAPSMDLLKETAKELEAHVFGEVSIPPELDVEVD